MTSKEWKEYKIGTICEVLSSKRIFAADYVETGIPFYRSKEIIQKSLGENIEEKLYISKEKFLDIKTKFGVPQKLDLLLSAVGERSGIPYLVNDDEEFYFKDGNLIWFRNFNSNLINSNYLYYWLKSYTGQNSLQNLMIGSAQKALTIIGIKGLSIKLPPLKIQEKIARILSSLDDKIELNNKINQNLEQQAQAIFKSWFVDFEPFGGQMPEDWSLKTLSDVSNITAGGDKPDIVSNIETEECKIPIYSNGIDNNGLYGYTTEPKILQESVTVSARGTIGFTCLRLHPYVPIVRLISLIPRTDIVSAKYLYFSLLNKNITGTGTTQQQLTVPYFKTTPIIVPTFDIVNQFTEIVNSFYKIIEKNICENKRLIQLRDTLLPKLMSGEIDVDKVDV